MNVVSDSGESWTGVRYRSVRQATTGCTRMVSSLPGPVEII